jgi:hypothetical protein
MKRSRLVLVLAGLPSLAVLPYSRQWFLWAVGPLLFYWPLLAMTAVVLALSIAGFVSSRAYLRMLLLLAVPVQFLSLFIASVQGFPASGEPLDFSGLERRIFLACECCYILDFFLLLREEPWSWGAPATRQWMRTLTSSRRMKKGPVKPPEDQGTPPA